MPTNELTYHLQYLIRTGELDRVQGVYHAFQNRADRHPYIGAFDEIVEGALADSGPDLAKRLARICRLADETDAKLADLCFRHLNPETRNGIAHEAGAKSQREAIAGSGPKLDVVPRLVNGGDNPESSDIYVPGAGSISHREGKAVADGSRA